MLLPRFTIRTAFIGVTILAVVFVVVGMAFRGDNWAWGITIGLVSLAVTMLVHAAWFGIVSIFARLPSAQPSAPARVLAGATSATSAQQSEPKVESPENRVEAKA